MRSQVIKIGVDYDDMGPANRLARQLSSLMNSNLIDDKKGDCIITITDKFGNEAEMHFTHDGAVWFSQNAVDKPRLKTRLKIE